MLFFSRSGCRKGGVLPRDQSRKEPYSASKMANSPIKRTKGLEDGAYIGGGLGGLVLCRTLTYKEFYDMTIF